MAPGRASLHVTLTPRPHGQSRSSLRIFRHGLRVPWEVIAAPRSWEVPLNHVPAIRSCCSVDRIAVNRQLRRSGMETRLLPCPWDRFVLPLATFLTGIRGPCNVRATGLDGNPETDVQNVFSSSPCTARMTLPPAQSNPPVCHLPVFPLSRSSPPHCFGGMQVWVTQSPSDLYLTGRLRCGYLRPKLNPPPPPSLT